MIGTVRICFARDKQGGLDEDHVCTSEFNLPLAVRLSNEGKYFDPPSVSLMRRLMASRDYAVEGPV